MDNGASLQYTEPGAGDPEERLTRLFAELHTVPDQPGNEPTEQRAAELLEALEGTLSPDAEFRFDKGVVKQSLDELLVVLIALRSRDANGKMLMDDLEQLFDSQLSPGSVYPRLHRMADDGLLEMFELVQSKEYRVEDTEQAAAMAAEAARQHLAVGAFLHAAASDI